MVEINEKLLIEGVVVGISLLLINSVVSTLFNIKDVIRVSFVGGFLAHILFEISGVNKWYCDNGVACKKQDIISGIKEKILE